MAQVDTVVPNSLNYTDIKPQAVENYIMLCRYQPTATISAAKGGDLVKFLISGNGFLDPYSTYFSFKVTVPTGDLEPGEMRFLDRSAHSFFQRIVIRSQGVEVERLENYDVMAAMINDMVYSPEQCTQHYWEGFPTHECQPQFGAAMQNAYQLKNASDKDIWVANPPSTYTCLGTGSDPGAEPHTRQTNELRDYLFKWLCQGANPTIHGYIGETCFHNLTHFMLDSGTEAAFDYPILCDYTWATEQGVGFKTNADTSIYFADGQKTNDGLNVNKITDLNSFLYPVSFAYHLNGRRVPSLVHIDADIKSKHSQVRGTNTYNFMVPIYSGLIGLLMPEKKLLPLNLMPLDIEIVFNPQALYSSSLTGRRNYLVSDFYIYGNTFFFEYEIHRTLEASVADHGLFIYCNSFHHAPLQLLGTASIPSTIYIGMNLKSINSVHWLFMYTHFETSVTARKLHFVSHNIRKMQLLNGTYLIPQYPTEGNSGTSRDASHLGFFLELLKAWNKLHDPARDGSLHAYNWCGDGYYGYMDPIFSYQHTMYGKQSADAYQQNKWAALPDLNIEEGPNKGVPKLTNYNTCFIASQIINKQANVGRSQYGISLEGEELGSDHTMITGRKSQYPFCLQLWSDGKSSSHASYMITFLRADFIVYIRPDLQIVTLGK